jgi:hypothetical protein
VLFRSPDGSASAPALSNDGDTNTGIFFPAADTIAFTEGGAESMRIDSSGNVGIGTSSPNLLGASKSLLVQATSGNDAIIAAREPSTDTHISLYQQAGASYIIAGKSSGTPTHPLITYVGGSERMRIASDGRVYIGQTSAALSERFGVTNSSGIAAYFNGSTGSGAFTGDDLNHYMITCQSKAGTSATHYQIGFINSVGSTVGGITHNNSNTTYSTSSDYRLKENIAPMTGALDKVGLLKPCTYVWKSTGEASQGFIAHELQEVIPDAVVGEKDALNQDGSIRPQGIDTSYLVATLTAAIQELKAIVDAQAVQITALENK